MFHEKCPQKALSTSVLARNHPVSGDGTVVVQKALTGMTGAQTDWGETAATEFDLKLML